MDSPTNLTGWIIVMLGSSVVGTLIGTFLGAQLSRRMSIDTRRLQFVERQLQELYAPLAALRRELLEKSKLRVEVRKAAGASWRERFAGLSSEQADRVQKEEGPRYHGIIDYDNAQLRQELLPSYRKMLDLFRDRLWLAEESTTQHYGALVRFVQIWDRWTAEALPSDVVQRLGHSEDELSPLYAEINNRMVELRERVKRGAP